MADPTVQTYNTLAVPDANTLTGTSKNGNSVTGITGSYPDLSFHVLNTTDRAITVQLQSSTDNFASVTNDVGGTHVMGVGNVSATRLILPVRATVHAIKKCSGTATSANSATVTTSDLSSELKVGDLVQFGATASGEYYIVRATAATSTTVDRAVTTSTSGIWATTPASPTQQTAYRVKMTYASAPTTGAVTVMVFGTP